MLEKFAEDDFQIDSDDVLLAFSEAREAAPNDKSLLRIWTARYPEFADALITVDYARFEAGLTLLDDLEDGSEDAAVTVLGREVLAGRRGAAVSKPPLTSLITDAEAQGLDVNKLAQALRLDRLLLGRLEQRVLDAATLPLTLVRQVAQLLGRSTDEIAAYLRGSPRLAAQAHFRAKSAPMLSAPAVWVSFAQAIQSDQSLSDEDKAYWLGEIDGGVLGDGGRE